MDREATGLRRIAGIGAALERTLRAAGVRTLAELADRPAGELARITGKSQRTVEEWQARARELAAPEAPDAPEEPEPVERDRQRSVTFTVEVLLNEDGTVRYVRAEHVYTQSGHAEDGRDETASWSDWRTAARELTGFLEAHAGLAAQVPEPLPAATGPAAAGHRVRQLAAAPSPAWPGGVLPSADTPFTVRLPLDLGGLGLARARGLGYRATVMAKRLGEPSRQLAGEAAGTVEADAAGRFDVVVPCQGLAAGTYRLEAAVRLDGADDHVVALLENAVLGVLPAAGVQQPGQTAGVPPD
jgi:hypothetical protein